MRKISVACVLFLCSTPAWAQDCSKIENPTQRLACYDSAKKKPASKSAQKPKPQKFTEAEKSCVFDAEQKLNRAMPEARVQSTRAGLTGSYIDGQPRYFIEFDIQTASMTTTVVFGCVISHDGIVVTLPQGRKN